MGKLAAVVLNLAAILLAGCSIESTWNDTTGQDRSAVQAKSDLRDCEAKNSIADIGPNTTFEALAARDKFFVCMAGRGWHLGRA
jgi:hypothetical protein